MRTMVAVTAAGTLALGSIAGATAVPSKRVHDKPVLQVVNIKGHSPLNVFDAAMRRDHDERASDPTARDSSVPG